jgi:hypothetical protein
MSKRLAAQFRTLPCGEHDWLNMKFTAHIWNLGLEKMAEDDGFRLHTLSSNVTTLSFFYYHIKNDSILDINDSKKKKKKKKKKNKI